MIQDQNILNMILLLQRKRKGFDKKVLVKFKLDNSHFFITENGDF